MSVDIQLIIVKPSSWGWTHLSKHLFHLFQIVFAPISSCTFNASKGCGNLNTNPAFWIGPAEIPFQCWFTVGRFKVLHHLVRLMKKKTKRLQKTDETINEINFSCDCNFYIRSLIRQLTRNIERLSFLCVIQLCHFKLRTDETHH